MARVVRSSRGPLAAILAAALLGSVAAPARADELDQISDRLSTASGELRLMASQMRRPAGALGQLSSAAATQRLEAAVKDVGRGAYPDAAIVLYDLVENYPTLPAADRANYYLAEALFRKGDLLPARTYFTRVARRPRSPYLAASLERLVEIAIAVDDPAGADAWMRRLGGAAGGKRASLAYVTGKYLFEKGEYARAITRFESVALGSPHYFRSRYFAGTAAIAAKDLARATRTFAALLKVAPRTATDRRVVELSHLALGRLAYQAERPAEAIRHYLAIPRKSEVIDDALYELAWVYVRNKEFDKALRALGLLSITSPTEPALPEVRVLEGNLRIRRARLAGEAGGAGQDDHDRAEAAFAELKQAFQAPRAELDGLIAAKADPRIYLGQISGRPPAAPADGAAPAPVISSVAAAWLRVEPEVHRLVDIEQDLAQIDEDTRWAEMMIGRIDRAMGTAAKVNIFPTLADRRGRSIEILDDLYAIRLQLVAAERDLIVPTASPAERAELDRLEQARRGLADQIAALPAAERRESGRIALARGALVAVEESTAEIATTLRTIEAELGATRQRLADGGKLAAKDRAELTAELKAAQAELDAMKKELAIVRDDLVLGQDQAAVGDEAAGARADLRGELGAAIGAEHRTLAELARRLGSGERARAERIGELTTRAAAVGGQLDELNAAIETLVDEALRDVRAALDDERAKLVEDRKQLVAHQADARKLSGEVLPGAFRVVARRFYEILIRADVGLVDVAWALKEATDQVTRRVELDRARERRTLDTEFADTLDEARDAAAATAPPPASSTVEPKVPLKPKAPARPAPTQGKPTPTAGQPEPGGAPSR